MVAILTITVCGVPELDVGERLTAENGDPTLN